MCIQVVMRMLIVTVRELTASVGRASLRRVSAASVLKATTAMALDA